MYAMARNIQCRLQDNKKIFIDDSAVLEKGWVNSLEYYDLNNVEYVHKRRRCFIRPFFVHLILLKLYYMYCKHFGRGSYIKKYEFEKKMSSIFEKNGLIVCENGYLPFDNPPHNKNILLIGYFQSENYFKSVEEIIRKEFSLNDSLLSGYPGLDIIKSRNSVCVSIKIEHTVGNEASEVCKVDYWEKAVAYILKHVENPLFFICSDNVDYVKNNLIDVKKYDCVCQVKEYPAHISLAVMSLCRHFIIGNTSFGWWAQYLSTFKEKTVIAPSRWANTDCPFDIHQENWHLIEV
jgi:uncharacterized protein YkuJ